MSKRALDALEERVSDLEHLQKQDRREFRRFGRGCTLIIQCCAALRAVLGRYEKAVRGRDGDLAPAGRETSSASASRPRCGIITRSKQHLSKIFRVFDFIHYNK